MIKKAAAIYFISSFISIASAYFLEYVLQVKVCQLCLYQRIPYFVILILSITAFVVKSTIFQKGLLYFSTFVIVSGAGISVYHIGVLHGVFTAPSCSNTSIDQSNLNSIEEIHDVIINNNSLPCNVSSFEFLGMPLPVWNLIYIGGIFILLLTVFLYDRRDKKQVV